MHVYTCACVHVLMPRGSAKTRVQEEHGGDGEEEEVEEDEEDEEEEGSGSEWWVLVGSPLGEH